MRPGRGLSGTTRLGGIKGQWAVLRQEAEVESKQTNGKLG